MKSTLFNIVLVLAMALGSVSCKKEKEINVFHELHDVQKLVLAEMSLNKVGVISDEGAKGFDAFVNELKLGDRVAAYSFHTYIQAYIDLADLSDADVTVNDREKLVKLRLPPIQTQYIGRDIGVTEEHYRVSGLRSEITARERAQLKDAMSKALKEDLKNNDAYRSMLISDAQAKARGFFTILLKDKGYTSEITFKK